jgi:hypothetical protein
VTMCGTVGRFLRREGQSFKKPFFRLNNCG